MQIGRRWPEVALLTVSGHPFRPPHRYDAKGNVPRGGHPRARAITFLGIGIVANLLIGYAVFTAMAERRQNQERIDAYDRGEHLP